MAEYFTRAQAEALLPQLEPILLELRELRAELADIEEKVEALQLRMRGNGHEHQGEMAQLRERAATLIEQVNERVHRINELGVLVKDLQMGLVDFPARREGREVYLCWRLGEPRVAWWHTIEGGFAARQPLDD
jgi:hypothetical protein